MLELTVVKCFAFALLIGSLFVKNSADAVEALVVQDMSLVDSWKWSSSVVLVYLLACALAEVYNHPLIVQGRSLHEAPPPNVRSSILAFYGLIFLGVVGLLTGSNWAGDCNIFSAATPSSWFAGNFKQGFAPSIKGLALFFAINGILGVHAGLEGGPKKSLAIACFIATSTLYDVFRLDKWDGATRHGYPRGCT